MNVRLPPLASRPLALAILVLLASAAYFTVAAPLVAADAANRRQIAELRSELVRFERIAGERAGRKAELAALERQRAMQEGFLQGSNDTLIAAEIQNRIKTLVASGQGELASTQILPSATDGKLKRISVRGLIAIPLPGLVRVFHNLESATPFLFVDNVEIRPRLNPRRRGLEAVDAGILEVRFDTYGFVRSAD